ncbi:MAG: mobile mystery protein B [Phycisphaerales bacterium]
MLGNTREGETPLPDLSGLKLRHIQTRSQLDAAEIANIQSALLRYMTRPPSARDAPFDVPWLLRLHRQMFGEVWAWAGTTRRHGTNIGVEPMHIHLRLHDLCADLHAWRQAQMPLLEQGARLHHRAVSIHPFANGNGRWSRLLANIWLLRHSRRVVRWPETVIGCESSLRSEYLRAVRAADRGDLDPLIAMHAAHEADPFAPE